MKKELVWLHLSDIHFHPKTAWRDNIIRRELLTFLSRRFVSGLQKPDIIFCTGDIAFGETSGAPLKEQYKEAAKFFDDLLQCCDLTKDRLFLVPGNHDVNRKNISVDQQARLVEMAEKSRNHVGEINERFADCTFDHKSAMGRLAEYGDFVKEYRPELYKEHYHLYAHTLEINDFIVGIAGFNSAWSCAGPEDDRHVWLASEWQFNYMSEIINGADIRIGLIHHPFDWFSEAEQHDAESRASRSLHFLLHGHTHTSWVRPTENCIQLAAGAVGADTIDQFGVNLVRTDPLTGATTAHLFGYNKGWTIQPVADHADEGQWSFNSSLRLKKPQKYSAGSDANNKAVNHLSLPYVPPFCGREKLLNVLTDYLDHNSSIALYGMSGNGKTALIKKLHDQANFNSLKFLDINCSKQITAGEIFRRLLDVLNNRREDPQPPSGVTSREMAAGLLKSYPDPHTAYIWVNNAHLLMHNSKWRNAEVRILLESLSIAFPDWKFVFELNEKVDDGSFGVNCLLYEVPGLDKSGFAQLLVESAPLGQEEEWTYSGNSLKALFQWLGGGHGGTAHTLAAELLASIAREKRSTPWDVYQTIRQDVIDRLDEKLLSILHDEIIGDSERSLLRVLALYRNAIPQDHADKLEDGIGVSHAWQKLRRLGLLPIDNNKDHYLHGFITGWIRQKMALGDAEFSPDYASSIPEEISSKHLLIAQCWQHQIGRQIEQINLQRANEAFYHLLCADSLADIDIWIAHLEGKEIGWSESALWGIYHRRRDAGESVIRQQEVLQIIVNIYPRDSKAWRFYGESLQKTQSLGCDEAIYAFEKALQLNPNFPPGVANLGQALLAQGKAGAEIFLERLETHQKDYPDSVNNYVQSVQNRCIQLVVDAAEASRQRRLAIEEGSVNSALYNEEALYQLEQQQNPDKSLKILEKAQSFGATDVYTDSILGKVLEQLGRGPEASQLRMNLILEGTVDDVIFCDEIYYQLEKAEDLPKSIELLNLFEAKGGSQSWIERLRRKILTMQSQKNHGYVAEKKIFKWSLPHHG
ncbi:metallophosphoesterase [Pseudomonas sp. SC3(2021)]|uniref:metallophosphoesterase n=1 Tax=Pseudomonas sp. SC3(2021) TaxID=2871493 RepID=UPI001C9DF16D|nr:metallophosphoesterase [Pseudomonas sp. SC3(2021)]